MTVFYYERTARGDYTPVKADHAPGERLTPARRRHTTPIIQQPVEEHMPLEFLVAAYPRGE